jgi:ATP-dependent helicase/nuclease subunit A
LYVGAPVGDRVVEGYLDLLVRTAEGLVVVDYKTDYLASPGELDERVRRYRPQAAAYAVAVSAVLGEPVARAVFVFCTPTDPIEREVIDLAAAMAEVRASLSAPPPG